MGAMELDQIHRITKALSDPRRLEILERIASQKEMGCAALADQMPVSQATISHHLKELAAAGLIDVRREAKFGYFRMKRGVWSKYLKEMKRRMEPSEKD